MQERDPTTDPVSGVSRAARVALLVVLVAGLAGGCAASAGARQVPRGFFGASFEGSVLDRGGPLLDHETRLMAASGVESVRATFSWDQAQPYEQLADVPAEQRSRFRVVDGVPTDFSATDQLVRTAALRRFHLIPVVLRAPAWDSRHPGKLASPPAGTAGYARYLRALVGRYGPEGSFWAENPTVPRRPQRDWQIWNEPGQAKFFWSDQPFAKDYVALLRASRQAITSADPGARIILAGLVGLSNNDLQRIYDAGGRGLFDVAAVHPFTYYASNAVVLVKRFRRTLDRNGDRKVPLVISELTWPSAKGKITDGYGFEVTEKQQAQRIRQLFPLLVRKRRSLRLEGVIWYVWASKDTTQDTFMYSGLRHYRKGRITPKPAYFAFRTIALRYER